MASPPPKQPSPPLVQPAGTAWHETRALGQLAWPIVVGQVGMVTMGLVDVAVCGHEGADILAAVGAGRIFSFGVVLFGLGALRGLEPLFAQAWGAGEHQQLPTALARCLAFAFAVSVPIALLHLLCGPALTLLQQPPEIIPAAHEYASIRAVGVPAAFGFSAMAVWLQGQGRVRAPMLVVMIGNVINLILDLILIRGVELGAGWSIPAFGASGCAWASNAVEFSWLLLLGWICRDALRDALRTPRRALWSASAWQTMCSLGLPVGVQTSLEVWAFNVTGLMVGMLGAAALGAHVIAMQIISFTFMVPFGIGAAASARVGNLVGAGHPWRRTGLIAVAMGTAWMAASALLLLVLGETVCRLFTTESKVLAVVLTLLPVAAVFQVADGVQAVAFGVLRGAGDTRVPAMMNVVAYWLVGLPVGWWVGLMVTKEPWGVWSGLVVGLVLVASLMMGRLWLVSGRQTLRVTSAAPPP
ncbi:MAG TPA: hypothetical protein DFR83_02750 [Deltaproteobacteria bacterium]|nr:hypothetical protein [Deltaproteobacteria bacterium]